jgi:hypothetical protein
LNHLLTERRIEEMRLFSNINRKKKGNFMLVILALVLLVSVPVMADHDDEDEMEGFCSTTARAAHKACKNEVKDDYWIGVGNCLNLADSEASADCLENTREEFMESRKECKDQREARLEICEELGEAPYDPLIDPDEFVDFEKVIEGEENFTPNAYFPLEPGSTREYLAKDKDGTVTERILVEVLEETKEILGVNCIVVRDRVWEIDEEGEEELIEDTYDWHAQDLIGNVWYFGEIAKNFEDGELVDIEGSWKAGRDFAKAGILMKAAPEVGDFYRQEFALGDAEDMGEVISTTGSATVPAASCSGDCVVTRDWTPIEPDVEENKYYAAGIGVILEVNPEDGERVELISHVTP